MSFTVRFDEEKIAEAIMRAFAARSTKPADLEESIRKYFEQGWRLGRSTEMIHEAYDSSELYRLARGLRELWQEACRIADAIRKVRVCAMRRRRRQLSQRLAQSDAKSISLHASVPVPPTFPKKGGQLYALEMGA